MAFLSQILSFKKGINTIFFEIIMVYYLKALNTARSLAKRRKTEVMINALQTGLSTAPRSPVRIPY
jgi:hypothetical protein